MIVPSVEFNVGDYFKVIKGYNATQDASWIHTGDVVKVIKVYPHVILVERTKRNGDGSRMRECFQKQSFFINLKKMENIL